MIRKQHDRSARAGYFHEFAKQTVMHSIDAIHHFAVDAQVRGLDMAHARRSVLHEVMTDGVDGVVEHHGAVPCAAAQRLECGVMQRTHPREFLGKRCRALIATRCLRSIGQQFFELIASDIGDTHASRSDTSCGLWRTMHYPTHQWPGRTC